MVSEQKPLAGPCQDTSYTCVKNKNIGEDISAALLCEADFTLGLGRSLNKQNKQLQ